MSDKMPVAVYRINEESKLTEIKKHLIDNRYQNQILTITNASWNISMFYQKLQSHIKWKDFIRPIVDQTQDVISNDSQLNESIVVLFEKSDSGVIYGVVTGNGYFILAEYLDPEFGIDILSRIVKKEERILKSTKEASLAGGIFGEIRFFRQSFNLYENESFGSFYQELKTLIDKDILRTQLGFSAEELKKDNLCIAKSSFKITKSIDFTKLISILDGFENILATKTPIDINNVRKLSKQIDKDLIQKLKIRLAFKLFQKYKGSKAAYNYDLCHSDFEKYLTADHYSVTKGTKKYGEDTILNLVYYEQLCEMIRSTDGDVASIRDFVNKYHDLIIESYDSNSVLLTRGRAIAHIIADLEYDKERYFFIENTWYQINNKYIDQLNLECNSFIDASYHSNTMLPWVAGLAAENDYNALYFGMKNTLVLDKITQENIEICDILKWDSENLYLYHVKIGMGNTMRDLCSQIFISAQRIKRDIESDRSFLEAYYASIEAKIGGSSYFDKAGKQTQQISKDDFISLFRKKIKYVLVVQDDVAKARSIKNIEKYNSNIAKLSISELYKKMKGIDVSLEIVQI